VKRKNMTLKDLANYMLQARALPPKLWVEAIKYANYIHNIFTYKLFKGVTPYEAWSRKKPKVTDFRIFDFQAWARILSDRRKSMEAHSKECVFFGYVEGVKGYSLLYITL
jgi:hypothetical protein